jgi:hypothetical protein
VVGGAVAVAVVVEVMEVVVVVVVNQLYLIEKQEEIQIMHTNK